MPAIAIALVIVLPAALFYLGSRAVITAWLWSRYPRDFARFMDCAACSGFWYGAFCGNALLPSSILGDSWALRILNTGAVGLVTLVTTPIVAAIMARALTELGTAVSDD